MRYFKTVVLAVVLLTFSCIHEQPVTPGKDKLVQEMFMEVAPHIVECFHRSGTFKDAMVMSYQTEGRILRVFGDILWDGIASNHTLKIEFLIDNRENCLVRVIDDKAIMERDKQCVYTTWTPMVDYQHAVADSRDRFNSKVRKTIRELLSAMNREENQ